MTNQTDLNKDFVSMFRDLVDDIHKIKIMKDYGVAYEHSI